MKKENVVGFKRGAGVERTKTLLVFLSYINLRPSQSTKTPYKYLNYIKTPKTPQPPNKPIKNLILGF